MNDRYEYTDGASAKFWTVSVNGKTLTTEWGRIGTKGQSKSVAFESENKAKAEAEKAAAKKVKKGYRKVAAQKSQKSPKAKSSMDHKSFERAMKKEFKFKGGSFAGAAVLGFRHPDTGRKYNLGTLLAIPVSDTDTHFGAMAIADGDANEFVHITEPGEHCGRVFWNDHEEGLYSVDCMSDYEDELDIDTYEGLSKSERIEWMPFFEHPLADSLEAFFAGIQEFTEDEFWADESVDADADEEDSSETGFELGSEECWERLCAEELEPASLDVLGAFIDGLEDAAILWVDEPWAEIDYEALATDAAVGLVVFAQPVDVDGPLTLSAEMLMGDESMREERCFVFLDEVRCESMLTLSSTLAVFAGGLVAEKFACFAAPDATTHLGTRIKSAFVVSGGGDGSVDLWPGTEWNVKAMDGYAGGLTSAVEALSFDAETIEDDSVNSVVSNLADGYTKVPKSFTFPSRPNRKSSAKGKKASPRRMRAAELWDFLDSRAVSEGSRELFRGSSDYFFSNPEAFALVVADLSTARAAPDASDATVIVVTQPLSTKEALQLRSLGEGDEWFGYWFCEPVSCLDLSLTFNGLAVFEGGLNARIVSTAQADCHLRIEKHLECSVQCGAVYMADYARVDVGVVTGWFSGSAKVEEALPSLADDIEDEGSAWRVLLEQVDELPALKLPPEAAAKAHKKPQKTAAKGVTDEIAGKAFCVTGTFSEKRAVVQARIEAAGGVVHKSVRASTDYLVAGQKTGAAKRAAATKHGVKVLDAKAFEALF